MSEASNFASLGPTLLARKGGARPAMRSQLAALQGLDMAPSNPNEDLGWNDMGDEASEGGADVLQLKPQKDYAQPDNDPGESEVLRQQEAIIANLNQPLVQKQAPAKPRKSALEQGRRAAFTLRLDAERHLKLRLASTIKNCSAQQLVTDALDALLQEISDLETLADQVSSK